MPTHLQLSQRKVLAARMTVAETMRPHLSQIDNACGRVCLPPRNAVDWQIHVLDHAAMAAGNSGDRVPLDDSIAALPSALQTVLAAASGHVAFPAVQQALATLPQGVRRIDCRRCSGSAPVCDGTDAAHDDALVANGGECLSWFKALMAEAQDIAAAYYATYAATAPPALPLSTGFLNQPATGPMACGLGGKTVFADAGGAKTSEVVLSFDLNGLDWTAFEAGLYILLHEIVCHGFQAVRAAAPRPGQKKYDLFGEGWMDVVVRMMLHDLALGAGPAAAQAARPHMPAHVAKGIALHEGRCGRGYSPDNAAGADAATATFNALAGIAGLAAARDLFYRLSLQLNVAALETKARNTYVHMSDTCLNLPIPEAPDWARILRDFAGHQDADRLIAAIGLRPDGSFNPLSPFIDSRFAKV